MSQVMSPLGALLLNTTATNPNTTSPTGSNHSINSSNHDDQVLKLMSVSLLNESSRALNFHHSLALTLATTTGNCRQSNNNNNNNNTTKMTLKSSSPCINSSSSSELDQQQGHIMTRDIHHHHHHHHPHPHPHRQQQQHQIRPDSSTGSSPSDGGTINSTCFIDHPEEFHSSSSKHSPSHNNTTSTTPITTIIGISQNNNHNNHNHIISMNDEDEVLSIGREDDDQVLLDCDSSLMSDDDEGSMMTTTTTTTTVLNSKGNMTIMSSSRDRDDNSLCSEDLISNPSPSPILASSENNFCSISSNNNISRNRNYSSEDCSSVKSLPYSLVSSLVNDAITMNKQNSNNNNNNNNNNNRQQQNHLHNQTSLMFSIANILRPDFGVGKLSPVRATPTTIMKQRKHHHHHHHHHHNLQNHHVIGTPTGLPVNKRSSSKATTVGQQQQHQQHSNNKIQRRHEPIIPIDLSRPSVNGSPLLPLPTLPSSGRHKSSTSTSNNNHHHRKSSTTAEKKEKASVVPAQRENESKSSSPVTNPKSPTTTTENSNSNNNNHLFPAWIYCTRYSDRPSSGPRSRRGRKKEKEIDEKRPRTAFTAEQLSRLKKEFDENRYLTEKRRQDLAKDLRLHENQIKIWFQNKRAKLKKSTGQRGGLALQLMAQGLYNHSTIPTKGCGQDEEDDSD